MNIYALICTRSNKPGKSLNKIISFYKYCGIRTILLEDKNSIFEAYNEGYNYVRGLSDDKNFILIMCHDDIEILSNREHFLHNLSVLAKPDIGIVGVAGSERLVESGMWWDKNEWAFGRLKGQVFHHDDLFPTVYGTYGEVAILDGLFMAAHGNTSEKINFSKPSYFSGDWDYYDVHICHQARVDHKLTNLVLPIQINHHSSGEGVAGEGWIKNKDAFIERYVVGRKYGI